MYYIQYKLNLKQTPLQSIQVPINFKCPEYRGFTLSRACFFSRHKKGPFYKPPFNAYPFVKFSRRFELIFVPSGPSVLFHSTTTSVYWGTRRSCTASLDQYPAFSWGAASSVSQSFLADSRHLHHCVMSYHSSLGKVSDISHPHSATCYIHSKS